MLLSLFSPKLNFPWNWIAGSLGQLADILSYQQEKLVWEISRKLSLVCLDSSPRVNTHTDTDSQGIGLGEKGPKSSGFASVWFAFRNGRSMMQIQSMEQSRLGNIYMIWMHRNPWDLMGCTPECWGCWLIWLWDHSYLWKVMAIQGGSSGLEGSKCHFCLQ